MALLLTAGLAQAQTTYTVPNDVAFTDPSVTPNPVPAAPADGSTITLEGGASITSPITLPTGATSPAADLTIGAASGGSSVTIATGIPGFSNTTNNPVILDIGGGNITFSGGSISTAGTAGSVIRSTGAGGVTINAKNALALNNNSGGSGNGAAIYAVGDVNLTAVSNIVMDGNSAGEGSGIFTTVGGVTIDSGGSIDMSNNYAVYNGAAIYAAGPISVTAADGIKMSNNQAPGGGGVLEAGVGNEAISLVATSGDITITGNSSRSGAGTLGSAVSLTATSGNITISGNSGISVFGGAIRAGTSATLAASTIAITGNTATTGAGIISSGGTISLAATSGVTITGNSTVSGGSGNGGALYSGGDTTLSGSTIATNTAINNGGAIDAEGNFTLASTTTDTISANKAGGLGGAIYVGGNATLNAAAGGITFSGNTQNTAATAQANAIYLNNTPAATTTTLTLNAQGYPITFDDPIQNNPANGLITVTATGGNTVIFDGASQAGNAANQQSLIDGATTVTSGTTFAVRNNAVYGALAAEVTGGVASSFTVDNNAILAGGTTFANGTSAVHADTFTLAGTLNIAGNDAPGTAAGKQASFSQFTVSSSGTDTLTGGTVVFNTCLNDAATQLSDQLALDLNGGTTTGTATIQVNPVTTGCTGALTQGNGILLVNVSNGATAADAFKLAAPVVAANGYTYSLKQASDGNWYLQGAAPLNDGINGGTVPTPIDARWMLGLIGLLLASFGMRAMRRA